MASALLPSGYAALWVLEVRRSIDLGQAGIPGAPLDDATCSVQASGDTAARAVSPTFRTHIGKIVQVDGGFPSCT